MRLKLTFSYDGSAFLGSASQPHGRGVADALQGALERLGIFSRPLFASRTDKGVHALGAVASADCGEHFADLFYLQNQLNRFAHPFIHIKRIERVPENFSPRFSARAREYRYVFHHGTFSPFLARFVCFAPRFDMVRANALLQDFVGVRDFKFFQKEGGNSKSSVREIFEAGAYAHRDLSVFKFKANGFLRAQVRLSVGALLAVLRGDLSAENLREQIAAQKCHHRLLAPACGLYLRRVIY
ncbi:tRNA pseudouridine(38-40) synthase TruA [Campylobacter sp.]|uniref:tRNA pseudouridine(38-40) synthase TruA n=1 Tax=Campylobacter sp. TaxID=205 RepID=UPI0026DC78B8|nr:tRNA pseudouridine(38-40) synthase TruA [Campylobacter sp.]MDO4673959.1 tRNA pseudouridine(38-40) synthase TruA [Campylobacter sp.]